MTPNILILAAGSSSRMRGADKLLEVVEGAPLLRRVAGVALATGCPVTLVLAADRPARRAALDGLDVASVTATEATEGMAASLVAGVQSLPEGSAVLLLLSDLPLIDTPDLTAVIAASAADPACVWRGADPDGTPGHPVLFPADLRGELLGLTGDEGARWVLARHAARVRLVTLPQGHATTDLDTPEAWAAWRAGGTAP
ncbi:CTP--molybdopterin cytidylyltransferase [Gemmobacter aquarius]|uniref:CTP--molybdopterin cytidylyltransferase n=1 Tax=Paragemmobacter aquarius TaxID=2169400 RepID=A0A2S0ULG8_9RHOB|nr:nucleotidyltransferase family protein [Gemmobacter aquarius]AWB48655.1 CTP--molybdopterin cytidylyltransferase [Gemmobacter aquarius]